MDIVRRSRISFSNSAPAKTPATNWESGLKSRAPTYDLTADLDIVKILDVGSLIVAALNSAAALQALECKTSAAISACSREIYHYSLILNPYSLIPNP